MRRPAPPGRSGRRRLAVAVLTPLFALTPTLADAQGAWLTVKPLGTARSHLAAATAPCPSGFSGHKDSDTCVYAIGGTSNGTNVLDSVEAYNPATNTWITVASLGTPRRDLAAATAPCPGSGGEHNNGNGNGNNGGNNNEKHNRICVYAYGGTSNGTNTLETVEAYNPATNTWTPVTPMETARRELAGASAPCPKGISGHKDSDTCVYAIGGTSNGTNVLDSVEAYNPAKNKWEELADLPTGRSGAAAAAAPCPSVVTDHPETCVYALDGSPTAQSQAVAYIPTANVWATLPVLPTARKGLAAAAAPCPADRKQGCVYGVGGTVAGTPVGATEAYHPAVNVWSTLPPLPTPRTNLAAATAPCPKGLHRTCVYAIGGESTNGQQLKVLKTVEAFAIE
ncbi:Kelch repeat-containing protein [Streptomyces sp. NPDC096132]|uniref:Kelch repeat-containing protein n=1 Tax=Streptomyces sp. NPDC096132 TaxID=3366075 RepID=UPI00382E9F3D